MKINDEPIRYALSQTTTKKSLFSKKEITKYAIGDENRNELTPYEFFWIKPYENGIANACLAKKNGSPIFVCIDTDGRQMLKPYNDSGYNVSWDNGYYSVNRGIGSLGLAARNETVLIEPKGNNYLERIGDIVLYGDRSPVGLDYCELGIGKLVGNEMVRIVPRKYNHVQILEGRVVLAGRYVVTKTTTPSSLTKDRITTTSRLAFQLYSVDTGKINDLVFGEIHKTKNGNYSAIVYPKIKPEELLHRQTVGEAFSGAGLLDFSDKKRIVLDADFEFPN